MQIRCMYCHKPFALSRDALHAALDEIEAQKLSHHNAYCPHCRRANRLSKAELLRATPDWQAHRPSTEEPTTE